ncbi:hypothetical protein GOP47_0005842 [Adiantum capillus-veneris]|uniref:Uncharacterized protein n=1 Tax=Adiantum capillus-veneris TaxID=13818 RepID=A0A9D4ZLS2_ADICA|nr:hypothetical protein GOP47_0005842 [Adiantum capillus-veneris]
MHHAFAPIAPTHLCSLQKASFSANYVKQSIQRKKKKQIRVTLVVKATSMPSFAKQPNPSLTGNTGSTADPVYSTAQNSSTNGKWLRDDESALRRTEPLPLPMTYPGSAPAHKDVENMKNCDPEIKDCRDVIYQWTGECSRCQGTGDVNYHNREGREVIWKCITCLGLGYVHKVTFRTDIGVIEEVGAA